MMNLRKSISLSACGLMIFAFPMNAWAQTPTDGASAPLPVTEPAAGSTPDLDTGLENFYNLMSPVVTTATKDARRLEDAPSVIMVLTREEMRTWGYYTVAEALKHILGFYVVDDHVVPNLAVRGVSGGLRAESGVVKVLLNGAPVSFRSTTGNWLGAELIPLSALDRIEIIRGPVSALYGADAFLGVINIITRSDQEDGAVLTAGANWLGTNRTVGYDVDAAATTHLGKLDLTLAARLQAEDRTGLRLHTPPTAPNAAALPDYAGGRTTSTTDLQPARVAFARARYKLSDKTSLSLTGALSYFERVDEFAGLVALANGLDPQGRLSQNRDARLQGLANLQLASSLTDTFDLTALLTLFAGGTREFTREEVGSAFYYARRSYGYNGGDGNVEGRWAIMPELALTVGVNLIFDNEARPSIDNITKLTIGSTPPGLPIADFSTVQGHALIFNAGAYVQALWTVDERYLTVAAGFRYDYHTIYHGQPSARVGLVSQPWEKLYVKLLYGNAFKAPSPYLLYAVPAHPGDVTGNLSLLPQRINTVELEVSRSFLDFMTVSTGLAYSRLTNQATFTQSGSYDIAANLSSLDSVSWETRLRLYRSEDIEGYASFELSYVTRKSGDNGYKDTLLGAGNVIYPPVQVHAGVIKWMPAWHLRGMLDFTYASSRRGSDTNVLINAADYRLPQYFDVGAGLSTVGLNLFENKATTISLTVRNLLGQDPGDPGYAGVDYPLVPRTVFAYLTQEI